MAAAPDIPVSDAMCIVKLIFVSKKFTVFIQSGGKEVSQRQEQENVSNEYEEK